MRQLPEKFQERLKQQLGEEGFAQFLAAFQGRPSTSLRLNPLKPTDKFAQETPVPWCPGGYYLHKRPEFVRDPLIFAGAYYVQEASSMFLSAALRQHAPLQEDLRVLDLCAAPGGKSTLIQSLLTPGSLLVSNELMPKRLEVLKENIVRWGAPNVFVSHNEAADFAPLQEYFDVMAIDAPCSGEGMFRKDEKAVDMWSTGLVASCASLQREILSDISGSLKPGGLLVYSTCTFAPQENEDNIRFLAESGEFEPLRLQLGEDWGVTELEVEAEGRPWWGYRFIFHKTRGEGLFLTCFRKKGEREDAQPLHPNKKQQKVNAVGKKELPAVQQWVSEPEDYAYIWRDEHATAIPNHALHDYKLMQGVLKLHKAGVEMGKLNKKDGQLIPTHELSASSILSGDVPSFELDYEQAVDYLRRQELSLDTGSFRGLALVRFAGIALGWIKVLPNRINNLYPMDLRIRKEL